MAKVQINYKSGQSMSVEVDSFKIKSGVGGGYGFEWENMRPRALLLGADEIESVWELPDGS